MRVLVLSISKRYTVRPYHAGVTVTVPYRLLKGADIATPIVFVGHSLGGEIGALFEATYPTEVAGAVLVEPVFAGMVQAMQAELPPTTHPTAEWIAVLEDVRRRLRCRRGQATRG